MMLMVATSNVFAQAGSSKPTEDNSQTQLTHEQVAITGCLTKNSLNEYELVDHKGVHYRPYSSTIKLDSYVGKEVTMVGRRGAMPSTDVTARSAPHFQVSKVQSTSGNCKK